MAKSDGEVVVRCSYCRSRYFVFFLVDQDKYSSPTEWFFYRDNVEHPNALCNQCSRPVTDIKLVRRKESDGK